MLACIRYAGVLFVVRVPIRAKPVTALAIDMSRQAPARIAQPDLTEFAPFEQVCQHYLDTAREEVAKSSAPARVNVEIVCSFAMRDTDRGTQMSVNNPPFVKLNVMFSEITLVELEAGLQKQLCNVVRQSETGLILP